MLNNDQLITLIIPTRNRHRILHGTLKYYIKNRFRGKILVLDSSSKKSIKATRRVCDKIASEGLDVALARIDQSKHDGMAIQSILDYIDTPYVLRCGDNEIAIVNGLVECLNFLQKNSDYVAASGMRCIKTQHKNTVGLHYIQCLELETNYVRDRLTTYFRLKQPTTYYVHRTKVWKEMFKYAHLTPNNWLGSEVLPGAISAARGRIKDALKTSRYRAIFSQDDGEYGSKYINPSDWLFTEDYVKSVKVMRSVIVKLLVEGGMSQTEAKTFLERELWLYMTLTLLYKFAEKYPHLKPAIDSYSLTLNSYPFVWRRNEITTSLTQEPDILSLFKKECTKHGKSDPFRSE